MISYAQEMDFADKMAFQNSVNVHALLYPKSQGVMALESYLYGKTSISTEGVWAKIKETSSKIVAKASELVKKFGSFIAQNKYWVIGGLAVAAAFTATAVAIIKRGQDKAKKGEGEAKEASKDIRKTLSKVFAEAKERIKKIKEERKVAKRSKNAVKNAVSARDQRRNERFARIDAMKKREAAEEKGVGDTSKVKGILGKIMNSIKGLFGMTKSNAADLEHVSKEAGAQAGNESWITTVTWFKKHPVKRVALAFLTSGISEVYRSIALSHALVELCVIHTQDATVTTGGPAPAAA